MGQRTLHILLSLAGAAVAAGFFFALVAMIWPVAHGKDAILFRFQLSSMLAWAVFAGVSLLLYIRLSRRR